MEAFAQFSSDLDNKTLKILSKWKRLVELLKQVDNAPISFDKQAALLYIWSKWYLDDIHVDKILDVEKSLFAKLDGSFRDLADLIKDEKQLTPEIESKLEKLAHECRTEFINDID